MKANKLLLFCTLLVCGLLKTQDAIAQNVSSDPLFSAFTMGFGDVVQGDNHLESALGQALLGPEEIDLTHAEGGFLAYCRKLRRVIGITVNGADITETVVCRGDTLTMLTTGGVDVARFACWYHWSSLDGAGNLLPTSDFAPDSLQTMNPTSIASAFPETTARYVLTVTDCNACRDYDTVLVNVLRPTATIDLPQNNLSPLATNVNIPLRLTQANADFLQPECMPDSLKLSVRFNNTLFAPKSISPGTFTYNLAAGTMNISIPFSQAVPLAINQILTNITGDVLLGNEEMTPLEITADPLMAWSGVRVETSVDNGNIRLDTICIEGGPRLLTYPNGFGIVAMSANPVKGNQINVSVKTFEAAETRLDVYSLYGQLLSSNVWNAPLPANDVATEHTILLGAIPSGTYQIVLRSPTMIESRRFLIIR